MRLTKLFILFLLLFSTVAQAYDRPLYRDIYRNLSKDLTYISQDSEETVPDGAISSPLSEQLIATNKGLFAWGFDRLVDSYEGDTVRLKRLSDNAEANFGANTPTGAFNISAVNTWRAGANVDVVYFFDQMESAETLKPADTVAFIRSDVVKRFGATRSDTDGQLTRSGDLGGVGADTGDAVAALYTGDLNIDVGAGIEIHLLTSLNERKTSSGGVAGDAYGANSTTEYIMTYGTGSTNYIRHELGGANRDTLRVLAGADESGTSGGYYKQYAQQVWSYEINNTAARRYNDGFIDETATYTAGNATNIPAGGLDDGGIVVGGRFNTGTDTESVSTTTRANMLFGGVIVTKLLSDDERYLLREKLSAVGQQHRINSIAKIFSYFDELVLLKNVDPVTGLVDGEKANLTLDFTVDTVAAGTPDWDFEYAPAGIGLEGIRSPTDNDANAFKATSTYFAGVTRGTIVSLHQRETNNSNLTFVLTQADGDQYYGGTDTQNLSLSLGYDHQAPSSMALAAQDRDDDDLMGTRYKADETQFGATIYDLANQPQAKYNRNTVNQSFTYGETFSSHTWDAADWANAGDQPYDLDGPVVRHNADNITAPYKFNALTLQIATFDAPDTYDRTAAYAVRKALRLGSDNYSYVSYGGSPLGHRDGDIAHNPDGGVVDSVDDAYIMSKQGLLESFQGTRFMFGFALNPLTTSQVEEIQVNLYKLVAQEIVLPDELPANIIDAEITGTNVVGNTLSSYKGSWTGFPLPTFTYQWNRDGTPIAGADDPTYLLVLADQSKDITLTVTATNSSGSVDATSNTISVAAVNNPVNTGAPVVSGIEKDTQILSSTTGTWTGTAPITYAYQWYTSPSTPISGATSSTYTLQTSDIGDQVFCRVTATNVGASVSHDSNTTGVIGAAPAYTPISSVVASAVFELDATVADSYSGSGSTFFNIEASPADGSAQSAYDFAITALTFNGTSGNNAAYFSTMGLGYLTVPSMTSILDNLHRTAAAGGSDFWFIIFGQFVNGSTNQHFFSTSATLSTDIGVRSYLQTNEQNNFIQRGDSSFVQSTQAVALPLTTPTYFAQSHNATSGALRTWNGTTTKVATGAGYVTATGAASSTFRMLARAPTNGWMESGTRIYAIAFGNGYIDDADVAAIVSHIETRHSRAYD